MMTKKFLFIILFFIIFLFLMCGYVFGSVSYLTFDPSELLDDYTANLYGVSITLESLPYYIIIKVTDEDGNFTGVYRIFASDSTLYTNASINDDYQFSSSFTFWCDTGYYYGYTWNGELLIGGQGSSGSGSYLPSEFNTVYMYCSQPVYYYDEETNSYTEQLVFQQPPLTILNEVIQTVTLTGVLQEIVTLIPIVIVVIVGLIGLRKALRLLFQVLRRCLSL